MFALAPCIPGCAGPQEPWFGLSLGTPPALAQPYEQAPVCTSASSRVHVEYEVLLDVHLTTYLRTFSS